MAQGQIADKTTYLVVPFEEKDEALEAAGKLSDGSNAITFDRDKKLWYAKPGADLSKLSQWTPDPAKIDATSAESDPQVEFAQTLAVAGFVIDGLPQMDGKRHRVKTLDDKRGQRSGVYVGYLDGIPAGWYQDHRIHDKPVKWKANGKKLDKEAQAHLRAQAMQRVMERDARQQHVYEHNAKRASQAYALMPDAAADQTYLQTKKVKAYPGVKQDKRGRLVIPLNNETGDIRTLQRIDETGFKSLKKNGQKAGNFFVVGDGELQNGQPILYAEGYSTSASIAEATGRPVVMTVDAGNAPAVADKLKDKYPESAHVFLGDDDRTNRVNKGREKAEEAATLTNGVFGVPEFDDQQRKAGLTDFNDLHQSSGLQAVRDQVETIVAQSQKVEKMSEEQNEKANNPVISEDFERYVNKGLNTERDQARTMRENEAATLRDPNTLSETRQLLDIVASQQKGSALGERAAAAAEEISRGDTASVAEVMSELETINKHPALAGQIAKATAELEQTQSAESRAEPLPERQAETQAEQQPEPSRDPNTLSETRQLLEVVASQQKGSALGEKAAAAAEDISRGDTASVAEVMSELETINKHPALARQIAKATAELERTKTAARQTQHESAEAEPEENTIEPHIEQQQAVNADVDARSWLQSRRQSAETILGSEAGREDQRRAEQERLNQQGTAAVQANQPEAIKQQAEPFADEPAFKPVVPDRVAKSYVEVEGKYYFAGRPDALAFVDKGAKLQTKLSNAQVAGSMVDVAESRGWTEIQVKGTQDFRREAWLEATSRGLEVRGYKPREEDLARLKKLTSERQSNEIEAREQADQPRTNQGQLARSRQQPETAIPREAASQAQAQAQEATQADQKPQANEPVNRLAGKVVEHGKAPYEHNKDNRESYYVTLENADGEKSTTWGVDLERAMEESGAKEGDTVELESQGRQPVTVNRPVKDEQGKVVRTEQINTHRNKWDVKAEALQDRERDAKEVVREHPDLVNEVAAIKVAEKFSQKQFSNETDRERFMDKVRTQVAGNVSKGQQAPEVKLREERVIEKENGNER